MERSVSSRNRSASSVGVTTPMRAVPSSTSFSMGTPRIAMGPLRRGRPVSYLLMTTTRPILVTGAHRWGTGWVGSMIAASPSPPVAYLWEPFSVLHRPGICEARFDRWFPYVCEENGSAYLAPIADMLAFQYKTMAELRSIRSTKDAARLLRDRRDFRRYDRRGARPLLKDPIAVFSAEWLCDSFGMDAVVLRPGTPPHSPTASCRATYDIRSATSSRSRFDGLRLILDRSMSRSDGSPPMSSRCWIKAILLWRIIHHVILTYRDCRPGWMFLRLEDVARDPLSTVPADLLPPRSGLR